MEQRLITLESLLSAMPSTIKADLRKFSIGSVKAASAEVDRLQIKLKLKVEKKDEDKYALLDVDDDDLTDSQIKKKRMQKAHKKQAELRE